MKTRDEFHTWMRIILGDPAGRRFSEELLDIGLREALAKLDAALPLPEPLPIPGHRDAYRVSGLDDARYTTVPPRLELTLTKGAAAAALRIRVASVIEVFGKRPEDADHLTALSAQLETDFDRELAAAANEENTRRSPYASRGFPI